MGIQRETFDGGLITSRHASLLPQGALTKAEGCRYRPNDPALWRAWGRTEYGTVAASKKVKGLAYCPFDPIADGLSDDFLIGYVEDDYYYSVYGGRTGTFAGPLAAHGTGDTLEAVHAFNKWYLLNGNSEGVGNLVLKPNTTAPSVRAHGMLPCTASALGPVITTSAGNWPLDETFWGEGRFFFFTTEVYDPGGLDELESAFSGSPPYVDLVKDSGGNILYNVTVSRHPNQVNSAATEVRFYMVKASLYQEWNNSLLAGAVMVGSTTITATATNDKIVLSEDSTFYTPPAGAGTVAQTNVTNPGNASVEDGTYAYTTSTTATLTLTNWNITIPAGVTVTGLALGVRGKTNGGGASIQCQYIYGAGPTSSSVHNLYFTPQDTDFILKTAPWPFNSTNTWGLSLTGTEVALSTFGVKLTIAVQSGKTLYIDGIYLTIYTSSVPTIGKNYPIIALQAGNVLTIHHANLPPPIAWTGDMYEGVLVLNNVANDNEIAYSLPGKPDYFPAVHKVAINPKERAKLMVIRRVGDLLVAFLKHQVYRINYLPLSTDPEFNPGRCYEEISADCGCVSKQGVTLFQPAGGPTLAAFVAHNGVWVTDGARCRIISEGLDWPNTVKASALDTAILINYPKEYVLMLQIIPYGSAATTNTHYYLFHYHPSLVNEQGQFKVTGPTPIKSSSACVAKYGTEQVLLVGHPTDGKVYVEDNAVTDAMGTGINMAFETREIYPMGVGESETIKRGWVHTNGAGADMVATSKLRYRNHDESLTDDTAETFNVDTEGLHLLQQHIGIIEAFRYNVSIPDVTAPDVNANIAFNYYAYDMDTHGAAGD